MGSPSTNHGLANGATNSKLGIASGITICRFGACESGITKHQPWSCEWAQQHPTLVLRVGSPSPSIGLASGITKHQNWYCDNDHQSPHMVLCVGSPTPKMVLRMGSPTPKVVLRVGSPCADLVFVTMGSPSTNHGLANGIINTQHGSCEWDRQAPALVLRVGP